MHRSPFASPWLRVSCFLGAALATGCSPLPDDAAWSEDEPAASSDGEPPELGYWLGEPYWGKGIMSEAVKAVLEAAFATRAYPRIKSRALAATPPRSTCWKRRASSVSARTWTRSGMRPASPRST